MNNTELITLLKEGSEAAFRELYEQFGKKVFNTCLNYVQQISDAEDLTQEVFIEVFHSIDKFNEESTLNTWIYRIAVNKCLDHIRSKKRKKRFAFLTSIFNPETGKELKGISNFDHPGIALEKKEDAEILFKAIGLLPDSQKTAYILTQIEENSQKEASTILNISEKALESLVQRAKANLRKEIGKKNNSTEGNEK